MSSAAPSAGPSVGSPATTTTDTLSAGAIAGIAVGIGVVCFVLVCLLLLALRRKQRQSQTRRRGVRCVSVSSVSNPSQLHGHGLARPVSARERAGAIVRGEFLNATSRTTGNVGAGAVPSSNRRLGASGAAATAADGLDSAHVVEMEEVQRGDSRGDGSAATSSIGSDSGVDADSMASLPVITGGGGQARAPSSSTPSADAARGQDQAGMAQLPSSSSFSAASTSSRGGKRVASFEQAKARETWWSSGMGG